MAPTPTDQHEQYQQPLQSPEQDAVQEAMEIEARDVLGMCLATEAEEMAKAAGAARGMGNTEDCVKYAEAALKLTQALVLVAPLEHTTPDQDTALPPKHLSPLPSASFADQQMQQQG